MHACHRHQACAFNSYQEKASPVKFVSDVGGRRRGGKHRSSAREKIWPPWIQGNGFKGGLTLDSYSWLLVQCCGGGGGASTEEEEAVE